METLGASFGVAFVCYMVWSMCMKLSKCSCSTFVLLYVYKWHKYYDCFVALSARNCAPTHVRPHKPLPEFLSGLFFFSSLCFSIIFFFCSENFETQQRAMWCNRLNICPFLQLDNAWGTGQVVIRSIYSYVHRAMCIFNCMSYVFVIVLGYLSRGRKSY